MDQCIDTLQGTGKVTLDEIVDRHYFDAATSVESGETLLILAVFRGADSTLKNPRFRIERKMTVRCSPSNMVTLFDQLVDDVGTQEPGNTSNLPKHDVNFHGKLTVEVQTYQNALRRHFFALFCWIFAGEREPSSSPVLIPVHNDGPGFRHRSRLL